MTLAAVRRQIRHAWRQYVVPAYTSRDTSTLLAALVVANAGLDELLLAEEYPGETTAERLGNAGRSFSDYAGLRAARHVRDQAVHRLGYPLCRRVVIHALASYALALWEHGVDLSDLRQDAAYDSYCAAALHAGQQVGGPDKAMVLLHST